MIAEFRLGPWLPDQTDLKNPGLEVCTNAIPGPDGYSPSYAVGTIAGDLLAVALSAKMFERADGTRVVVAATAGDLHTIINGTRDDSSLSLTLTEAPTFERFGASIYAASRDGVWYLDDLESDTVFAAATWDTPRGRAMGRVHDFLVMGDIEDVDTTDRPYAIRWSRYNNPQGDWESNVGTQGGSVDMPSQYGRVVAITSGTTGLVFQRNGVSRLFYTGGATVFGKQVVTTERGAVSRRSVVQVSGLVYFLADDGFYVHDGNDSQSISGGRVWRWFLDYIGQAYMDQVEGAVDWQKRCVVWALPNDAGAFGGLLYFNWETGQWSYINADCECLIPTGKDGLTLEQVSALYPLLDEMEPSLDSPEFRAAGRAFAIFRNNGTLRLMDGRTMQARFETGEFQVAPGMRTFTDEVTPLITCDDALVRVRLKGRNLQTGSTFSTDDTYIGPMGFAAFNFDARYYSVMISVDAASDWSDAYGFSMSHKPSGRT